MRRITILIAALMLAGCTAPGEPSAISPSATASTSKSQAAATINADAIALKPLMAPPIADRIVALANGSAEIIYALGAGSGLVGRDIASTFSGDSNVPIVTSAHAISAEKVLAQRPTLVITDSRSGPKEAITQIEQAGVRVRSIPDAWTLTDMPSKISAIGRLLGLRKESDLLVSQQREGFAKLEKKAKGIRVAFLYLRGTSSIYLLGGKGSGADALLQGIGAIDVGAQANLRAFTPLTSEGIVGLKPEVLLVMSKGLESVGGVDGLVKLPGIAQTEAGKNRRVVAVDDSLLLSFGPRTAQLMALMADAIKGEMK